MKYATRLLDLTVTLSNVLPRILQAAGRTCRKSLPAVVRIVAHRSSDNRLHVPEGVGAPRLMPPGTTLRIDEANIELG